MSDKTGAALPTGEYTVVCGERTTVTVPFISLRDWFAGMALQGWIARAVDSESMAEDLAKWAYRHADAMLKEREKS